MPVRNGSLTEESGGAARSGLPAGETAMQAALWRSAATLVQHVWAGTRAGRNES